MTTADAPPAEPESAPEPPPPAGVLLPRPAAAFVWADVEASGKRSFRVKLKPPTFADRFEEAEGAFANGGRRPADTLRRMATRAVIGWDGVTQTIVITSDSARPDRTYPFRTTQPAEFSADKLEKLLAADPTAFYSVVGRVVDLYETLPADEAKN